MPPETDTEITGPIPVIVDEPAAAPVVDVDQPGVDGQADTAPPAVTPQAPLDIRLLDTLTQFLQARPRWSERAPSTAETWEYSMSGDWTAEEKSLKRVLHGLCVLAAFALTYPIEWAIQIARQKPIGFLLVLAVLVLLGKVL
ncbi:hypothetical protein DMC63_38000 [Streptomyces sp. WAC 05977]|nr:hypothetical protein DMC63_38000 [Streptomyces sp. WAC 05977]